jgi:hypothetical protein
MFRLKSFIFTFSVLSIFLLFVIGLAAANLALADVEPGELLQASPESLNFVRVIVGTQSSSQTVTATNTSAKKLRIQSVNLDPAFVLTSNNCLGINISAGGSCQVQVACKPTALGLVTSTLTFVVNKENETNAHITEEVSLTCNAVAFATTGDVLVAGGDSGGFLGGVVPLATSTISTASAEIYKALTDTFMIVGSLNNDREASPATVVALPNHKTLIVGGSHCFAKTINAANGGPACGSSSFSGFECDALNTAELYDESTSTFTLAGSGSGNTMTTQRSGATSTLLADGTVLISGGSAGSSFLSLTPAPAGCGPAGQAAQNSAEIYNPATDTFTATAPIPGCALGTAPPSCTTGLPATCPLASTVPIDASPTGATESGSTVTITTTAANNFIPGLSVTVAGVPVSGYDGTFVVSTASGNTFTYTALSSGLASSGGGAATSDIGFRQCGLIDSAATLLLDGTFTVLVAGGDYLVFLGQSSQQAFIFIPAYAGGPAWAQTNPMNVPRELPGITNLLPSGDVLVAGGLTAATGACATGSVAFTTNSSAEVYNPFTHTWALTTGSMSVPRIAPALFFTSGPDALMAILAAGTDAETTDGAGTNTFPTCEPVTNIAQTSQTSTDLFSESTGLFTPTGALHQDRAGYGYAILHDGPNAGDLVAIGGSCGNGTLASAPIGTPTAGGLCSGGSGAGFTDYYELFNPTTGLWTVGASAPASTPAAAPASGLLP